MKLSKRNELILNSVSLIALAYLAYISFYELFIYKPGIHYPYMAFKPTGNGSTLAEFIINVPTVSCMFILATSLLGIYATIRIFILRISGCVGGTLKYWIIIITGFVLCLLAYIYLEFNFLNTAFRGVG